MKNERLEEILETLQIREDLYILTKNELLDLVIYLHNENKELKLDKDENNTIKYNFIESFANEIESYLDNDDISYKLNYNEKLYVFNIESKKMIVRWNNITALKNIVELFASNNNKEITYQKTDISEILHSNMQIKCIKLCYIVDKINFYFEVTYRNYLLEQIKIYTN